MPKKKAIQKTDKNPPAISVEKAIEECNRLHQLTERTADTAAKLTTTAAHLAVMLGLQLRALKAATPHGGWEILFGDSGSKSEPRFRFTSRTARKYMSAAEGALERPGLSAKHRDLLLSVGASVGNGDTSALADTDSVLDLQLTEEATEALGAATRGKTLRQLYLDLGIIKGDAIERGRPDPATVDEDEDGTDDSDQELPPPTPEELWELLWISGIRDVEKFFLQKNHTLLSRERAEELEDALDGWLKDLRALKWD